MLKSGGKLMGVGALMFVVGAVLGYLADTVKGSLSDNLIRACVVLCIAGASVLLYGLVKLVAGMFKRA